MLKNTRSYMPKKTRCPICSHATKHLFTKQVLGKYDANYLHCRYCCYLFINKPTWLKEAYSSPINIEDTGLVSRNLGLSKITSIIITIWFSRRGKFLDYAGGYGLLTRLMRDIGLDFYWLDKYTENLLARVFEHNKSNKKYELITAFEVFEHLQNPASELKKILKYGDSILFSTELIPARDNLKNWDYLGVEHGQHLSFYSEKSLEFLAKKHGLNYYTDHSMVHLFTPQSLSPLLFHNMIRLRSILFPLFSLLYKSKKQSDHEQLKGLR